MKLSIIIVTWNTAKITVKCVKTIQKYLSNKIKFEIIVVDNNSSDNTIELLSKEKITLIKNNENSGFAKGNNIGIKKATGEYILFLNSDMELIDDSILEMLDFLEKNKQVGLIGPKFLNIDKSPQGSVFPPQTATNAFKEFVLGIKSSYSKYVPNSKQAIKVWSISGGAMLLKRQFFLDIGQWDEKYFMYYEDMDLCRQVRIHHKKIYFYPQCRVIHAHGQSGKSLASSENQWKRLIPSSIKFHGYFKHYFINSIIWIGQKFH